MSPWLVGLCLLVNVGARTSNGRVLTLQADVTCCRFSDGDAVVTRVNLIFRPSTAQHPFRDARRAAAADTGRPHGGGE